VNEKSRTGRTPLHCACYSGHTATAVALIERGASVNEKDENGWTPLHHACLKRSSRSTTAIVLLENGAGLTLPVLFFE
jgi:ankyrin repeat protein